MASQIQSDDWHQRMQVNLPKHLNELHAIEKDLTVHLLPLTPRENLIARIQ